jgi:hypothetical protein
MPVSLAGMAKDPIEALAGHRPDGPIVALNLNRYRERAAYPPGTPDGDVSGREAYLRYGMVALPAIVSVGGRVPWATDVRHVAIGADDDRYDEVVAVWYPGRAALLGLETFAGYREAFELHRRAALERATLLLCDGEAEPRLSSPFGGYAAERSTRHLTGSRHRGGAGRGRGTPPRG